MKPTKPNTEPLLPPSAVEIEEAVLGAILLSNQNAHFIAALQPSAFYKLENGKIFEAIMEIIKAGKKPDILTVAEHLRGKGELQMVGGPGYIARLTNKIASDAHLEQHCLILKEKEIGRNLIELGQEMSRRSYDQTMNVFETSEYAADMLSKIMNFNTMKAQVSMVELGSMFFESLENAAKNKGITGLATGFKELDVLTGGAQKKEMIVIAARPGMGKTAFALCILLYAVLVCGKRMIFFSLEMSALSLFKRLAAIYLKMSANKFKSGDLTTGEWQYIHANIEAILNERIIIVDHLKSVPDMRNRVKQEKMKGPVDGVIVDFLQRANSGKKTNGRTDEVTNISNGLKDIAYDEDTVMFALSQLSRNVEDRKPPRPQLSDLRESGAIEQDADLVLFLYRAGYYDLAPAGQEHITDVIVEKHRNGMLQDIQLAYVHNQTKFINPEEFVSDKPF